MNETLRELQNLLIHGRSPQTEGVRFGMFMEIVQSLYLDGATTADWVSWQTCCHDTNVAHNYVARTLYQSSGAEVSR